MSLAGAGRSPHNYCRQAISAVRRKPNPTKQNVSFALFIADRQSPPSGAPTPPQSKTSVLRFLLPTGTPPSGVPPKKPPCLRPQRRQRIPAPSEAPPQSRAGTTSLLPTRLQPGAPTGKNEKRGRIKRPQRKGVTDNKKSFRGNRERIRKHREKTQPTGSTEKSRAEPSRNQSGT